MRREYVDPRLRYLAYELLEPYSRDFVQRSGITADMRVLEVGCGTGAMTPSLARMVGPNGQIIAIDVNADAIETAKDRVLSEDIHNVEFRNLSIEDVTALERNFDFIYGRFILMQLRNPLETLRKLVSCLRPQGVIAMDEPNQEADLSEPLCPPCRAANQLLLQFADSVGLSFRIGNRLYPMFRELGLEIIVSHAHQPILPLSLALQMFKHGLMDSISPLVDSGVIDEHSLSRLISDLDNWSCGPGDYYMLSRQVQVAGKIRQDQSMGRYKSSSISSWEVPGGVMCSSSD